MQDLVSVFLESVQAYLTQARDLENIHNEKMIESATSALEKAAKNELDEDVPEELKMVCTFEKIISPRTMNSMERQLKFSCCS